MRELANSRPTEGPLCFCFHGNQDELKVVCRFIKLQVLDDRKFDALKILEYCHDIEVHIVVILYQPCSSRL